MAISAGAVIDGTDFTFPSVVTAYGSGTNTITSTTFAVLPTTTCTAAITNPHPTLSMLTLVTYGAWMAATSNDVRMALDISGSITVAAGISASAAVGYGEIPICSTTPTGHYGASFTIELPVSVTAATFKTYAMRTTSGTQTCNYPTIRLIPLRFV